MSIFTEPEVLLFRGGSMAPPGYGHVLLKANGRIVGLPNRDEIGMEIDESLIVEFYSR